MGRIVVAVTVSSFTGPAREVACDALVDTGAYCLTLPAAWKDRLGPFPLSRPVQLETADPRVVEDEPCGPVMIRIDGFEPVAGEVLFIRSESAARFEPLLGYGTLEQAGIAVDLVGHRLLRVPHFDLKAAGA